MAAVLKFKQIKPSTLNIDGMIDALVAEAERVADEIETDFAFTTSTWDHQPKFEKEIDTTDGIAVLVGTDDEIYGYVNDGTRPHTIEPVNKSVLRFQAGYTPKTSPGSMTSKRGGSFGDFVYAKSVRHPGIRPRNFDKRISKEWESKYKSRMEGAMRDARHASGWEA